MSENESGGGVWQENFAGSFGKNSGTGILPVQRRRLKIFADETLDCPGANL
jgi:hypothetical protein